MINHHLSKFIPSLPVIISRIPNFWTGPYPSNVCHPSAANDMPSQRGGSNEWDGRQITMGNGENGWNHFWNILMYTFMCVLIYLCSQNGVQIWMKSCRFWIFSINDPILGHIHMFSENMVSPISKYFQWIVIMIIPSSHNPTSQLILGRSIRPSLPQHWRTKRSQPATLWSGWSLWIQASGKMVHF